MAEVSDRRPKALKRFDYLEQVSQEESWHVLYSGEHPDDDRHGLPSFWIGLDGPAKQRRRRPRWTRARVRETNRWAIALAKHRVRAFRLGLKSTVTMYQWLEILSRAHWACVYCESQATTVDHVVPLCAGGHDVRDNVVPACRACNSSKGRRALDAWLVKKRADVDSITARIAACHREAA